LHGSNLEWETSGKEKKNSNVKIFIKNIFFNIRAMQKPASFIPFIENQRFIALQ